MDFDCHEKKPLLFADLFKPNKINRANEKENNSVVMPTMFEGSSSSSSILSSFCDSSSSGFSTPFESELGSSEGEDGEFIAELTRQMAECMLQEEDEEEQTTTLNDNNSSEPETSSHVKEKKSHLYTDSAAIKNPKNGFHSTLYNLDDPKPPLEVYQFKNQPPVSKQGSVSRGRRFKGTEVFQPKQFHKTEHQYMKHRGREWANGYAGSGMQAVFLGGSASRNGLTGTGVFLPRVNSDPAQTKKKSGCSTVLIPTRVLQALELHFSRYSDTSAPPSSGGSHQDESTTSKGQRTGQLEVQNQRDDEMQLPQEWTY